VRRHPGVTGDFGNHRSDWLFHMAKRRPVERRFFVELQSVRQGRTDIYLLAERIDFFIFNWYYRALVEY
jgi:hypothetical protein